MYKAIYHGQWSNVPVKRYANAITCMYVKGSKWMKPPEYAWTIANLYWNFQDTGKFLYNCYNIATVGSYLWQWLNSCDLISEFPWKQRILKINTLDKFSMIIVGKMLFEICATCLSSVSAACGVIHRAAQRYNGFITWTEHSIWTILLYCSVDTT